MAIGNFAGQRVVIMGLGLHGGGIGAARFFAEQGAKVLVTDLKTKAALAPAIAQLKGLKITYVLGEHREADFQQADLIIKNPDVPASSRFLDIARQAGVAISTDVGIFFSLCPVPILGVTGTKGKTTTATLAAHLLRQQFAHVVLAGNVRRSVLSVLSEITPDTKVVLELSSFQLEVLPEIKKSPQVAVITNLFADHLNRYDSLDAYFSAKENIYRFQGPKDHILMNADDHYSAQRMPHNQNLLPFSTQKELETGIFLQGNEMLLRRDGTQTFLGRMSDSRLLGEHNRANVLAAVGAAVLFGLSPEHVQAGLISFAGVPYRQEEIAEINGVTYINDTASTTPQSTVVALHAMKKPIVLIAGGSEKQLPYEDLAQAIVAKTHAVVLLHDQASYRLAAAIDHVNPAHPIFWAYSMGDAVKYATAHAKPGDVVLLSPAAASFGLFANEFDRGDQFTSAVRSLVGSAEQKL